MMGPIVFSSTEATDFETPICPESSWDHMPLESAVQLGSFHMGDQVMCFENLYSVSHANQ
jgi:hypothetical protein